MKKAVILLLGALLMVSLLAGCVNNTSPDANQDNVQVENKTSVNTSELKALLNDDNVVIVDARKSAAFNGWTLAGKKREGHITGAKLFSATWLDKFEDQEALIKALEEEGITKDKKVITYGYKTVDNDEAKALADKLMVLGYENILTYEDGMEKWAEDENLPMTHLAKYEVLVYPELVNDLLKGESVAGFEGKEVKIFEAGWGKGEEYEKGHIPTAVHIDTDEFEEGPLWNRKSDADIEKAILANGITKDTVVILYGADTTPAARIGLILKYAGVEDVRLLDGGWAAWQDSGLEIETGKVEKAPVKEFGANVPVNSGYIIDMEEAKTVLADPDGRLCSIRSWVEFIGETSGYSYIEPKGRIAGATYAYAGSDPWHMEDYRNVDNTMINYEFMEQRWEKQGITKNNTNSFYCGTGWRAAETWFYAYALGWDKISLYDGGWNEWSSYPENPVEVGDPTK